MQYSGTEVFFKHDDLIVSKTDLKGKITYANHTFLEVAGYQESEVVGQPHNLIRHVNMPRTVFEYLWLTIPKGEEVFAYVVNKAKNGDYYWVIAHVTPSWKQGEIIGYHSTRRVPNPNTIKTVIEPLYDQLLSIEAKNSSPKGAIQDGLSALTGILNYKNITYNKLLASLMKDD